MPPAERQNWDSGIEVMMRACTFFRNFAIHSAALNVIDVWPITARFESTDFVQVIQL